MIKSSSFNTIAWLIGWLMIVRLRLSLVDWELLSHLISPSLLNITVSLNHPPGHWTFNIEALSSGEPKPIISNFARGPKAWGQYLIFLILGQIAPVFPGPKHLCPSALPPCVIQFISWNCKYILYHVICIPKYVYPCWASARPIKYWCYANTNTNTNTDMIQTKLEIEIQTKGATQ